VEGTPARRRPPYRPLDIRTVGEEKAHPQYFTFAALDVPKEQERGKDEQGPAPQTLRAALIGRLSPYDCRSHHLKQPLDASVAVLWSFIELV